MKGKGAEMPTGNIDVYHLIFEQTPAIFRWLFGILTLGGFTVATIAYKSHRDDVKEMRRSLEKVYERINEVEAAMNKQHSLIYREMLRVRSPSNYTQSPYIGDQED